MCNKHTLDHETKTRHERLLSRRDFNLLAFSAAAVALLPGSMHAARSIKESMVSIETADGVADAFFVHPVKGEYPGVLLWPDFMGLRPAYQQLARKLAQSGYAVLAVNPYYRNAKSPIVEKADFDDQDAMTKFSAYASAISRETIAADSKAFIGFLGGQTSVDTKRKLGTMGYCMSGSWTMHVAATFPERIGAIASFHGGGLADTDADPDKLMRVINKMRAQALIAIAEDDDTRAPRAKTILRDAFAKANLKAEIEVYKAPHGWCTPDMLTLYHEAEARRAWGRLLALFSRAL